MVICIYTPTTEDDMDVMTAYVQTLSNEALLDLARKNLVQSQARIVRAEVARRGLNLREG